MTGAYLPGNSTVELRAAPVPEPGHGEVLLRMKASTICGSDIRCIYHVKGQVFLWKQGQHWEDLWDLNGVIAQ